MLRTIWLRAALIAPLLLALGACAQPTPERGAPSPQPLTFGTPEDDEVRGLAAHSSGVYAVGATFGDLHGTQRGGGDAFVRKVHSSGDVIWGRQFGTPASDYALDVAVDSSGNAYVVGETGGSLAGWRGVADAFIRKYNANGSVLWTRQLGTAREERATGVAVYSSSIYVVGRTNGNLAGRDGGWDAFIRKYRTDGTVVWTRQFGTEVGNDEWSGRESDFANDVAVDGSGGVYVVGHTWGALQNLPDETFDEDPDLYVRKYSPGGGVQWTRQHDFGFDDEVGIAAATFGRHVYLTGYATRSFRDEETSYFVPVVKYSAGGAKVWEKFYLGSKFDSQDFVADAGTDSSGNLYLAGSTEVLPDELDPDPPPSSVDAFVLKLDPNGAQTWLKRLSTTATDRATAVVARSSTQLYVAGVTEGKLGPVNSGGVDAFLARLRGGDGSTVWTDQ